MRKQNTSLKNQTSRTSEKSQQRPHFSKAMLTIAKTNLKEFESQLLDFLKAGKAIKDHVSSVYKNIEIPKTTFQKFNISRIALL